MGKKLKLNDKTLKEHISDWSKSINQVNNNFTFKKGRFSKLCRLIALTYNKFFARIWPDEEKK